MKETGKPSRKVVELPQVLAGQPYFERAQRWERQSQGMDKALW